MTDHAARFAAVTGASRGIGRAATLLLARNGYTVFGLARTRADLQSLAEDSHGNIVPLTLDVADDESRATAVAAIEEHTSGHGLDVLVNNAGYGQLGAVEDIGPDALRHQFEVNLFGAIAFTQPFLPAMRNRHEGRIVNVSSAAGRIATPFMGAYCASKFALEGLSDAMRMELAPFGVWVILVEPGPVRTDFGRAAESLSPVPANSAYARFQRQTEQTHRLANLLEASSEDVAEVILKSVHARRPRARYTVTLEAKLATVARRAVPDTVMDRVLRIAMGLT